MTNGTLKGRQLLTALARKAQNASEGALGDYGVVSAVSGSLVAVRVISDTTDGSQLLARAAGPEILVGDTVALFPMKGGGYVVLKVGDREGVAVRDNGGSIVQSNAKVLDFQNGIGPAGSTAYEVNIAPIYGTGAGTIAEGNHTHATPIAIKQDTVAQGSVDAIDFFTPLSVNSIVSGEANIGLDMGIGGSLSLSPAVASRGTLATPARIDHWHSLPDVVPVGPIVSGRVMYLTNMSGIGTTAGFTLTANRAYWFPIFLTDDNDLDAILFEVTTAVSGAVRVAIYDNVTGSFLPNNRLAQSNATTQSTTGIKTQAFTASYTPITGRWHWLSLVSATAMAIRGISGAGATIPNLRGNTGAALTDWCAGVFSDIGSTTLPATAATLSSLSNAYLLLGIRAV